MGQSEPDMPPRGRWRLSLVAQTKCGWIVVKIWVGVTDKDWFDYLTRLEPDEVNFWQPSGSRNFRVLHTWGTVSLQAAQPEQLYCRRWLLRSVFGIAHLPGMGCLRAQERSFLA